MSDIQDADCSRLEIRLEREADTAALGAELALFAAAGDCICLTGSLGAGKTALARALIVALAGDEAQFNVPSPTFTLVQTYEETRIRVAHFDFYRLNDPSDVEETGFHDEFPGHLVLVEWPERLGRDLPADRLDVSLETAGSGRVATLIGHGAWRFRLDRLLAVRNFLASHEVSAASRRFLQGDASARRYERVCSEAGKPAILMDMPARPDGPPLRDGKSYSEIVHLAERLHAVVAVNAQLCRCGYSAPLTIACDLDHGLALIEDLGDNVFGAMRRAGKDMGPPMRCAVDLLVDVAGRDWPDRLSEQGQCHTITTYDTQAFAIESELLLDWFWPMLRAAPAAEQLRRGFNQVWQDLLSLAVTGRPVWVLRDYHSPNLIWLPERLGLGRVGLIDTQDCLLGPAAYDVVSLLQDARVDVGADEECEMLHHYCRSRAAADSGFDETEFRRSYAVMGAQRASKVLGIFARLSARDGKHGYLAHCVRVSEALERNLAHPDLASLKAWFDHNLPACERARAAQLTQAGQSL